MTLLDAALTALDRGWNIVPVNQHKAPHYILAETGFYTMTDAGKRAPSWRPLQQERVTPALLKEWFHPRRCVPGMAAITGAISNLVVLDLDGAAGVELLRQWQMPASANSGSGGPHLYFPHPGWPVRSLASGSFRNPPFPGLDVRGDGGMIVLPPSKLRNGQYRLLNSAYLNPRQLPEAVGLWTHLTRPPAPELPEQADTVALPSEDVSALLEEAFARAQGGRNNAGYWLARRMNANGYTKAEARGVMEQYVYQVPTTDSQGRHDPYTLRQAVSSLESAYRVSVRRQQSSMQAAPHLDPLVRARQVLPRLSLAERQELARLIAGTYVRESLAAAERALIDLGLSKQVAAEVQWQLAQGVSVAGKPKLKRFLERFH